MSSAAMSAPPPSPPGHWLFGHLLSFRKDVLGNLARWSTLGPVVQLRLLNKPAYLINEPALIEYPLVSNHRNYIKNQFFWRHVKPLVGNGLLTSEGDFWRRQRRLSAPAFHAPRIAEYGQVMVDYTLREMQRWRPDETRDLHRDMMALTSKIVAKTLFDDDHVEGDLGEVGAAMDTMVEEIAQRLVLPFKLPDWLPMQRRYFAAIASLHTVVERFIADHRAAPQPKNTLLGMLMAARDEDGAAMSDRQLRDESITLFLAGHETTAITLSWTLWLLSQHPEVEAQLADELRSLHGQPPQVGDLPRLRYTDWVVKESMRLYPPAYLIGREAVNADSIGGHAIPAGAVIYLSAWALHRNPLHFPEPLRFSPERWGNDLEKRLPRFAYMPFGGGPRTCIGDRFAVMEAVLILAALIQRYHFSYAAEKAPTPYPSITLRPMQGVPMTLALR
ncbi:MAG: cytochrome P450 [Nevskiales bacterium]